MDRAAAEPRIPRRADDAAADRGSALAFAGMVLVVLNDRFVLHLSPKGDLLALSAALL